MSTAAKALILILAVVALLGAAYKLYDLHATTLAAERKAGYDSGFAKAREEDQAKANTQLTAALGQVQVLTARVRELEAAAQDKIAAAVIKFQKERDDAKRDAASLRAANQRLRDPGRQATAAAGSCPGSGGSAGAASTANAGGGAGPDGGGTLSDEAGDFLRGEARRADALVSKLELARATLRTYIETCNAPLQPAHLDVHPLGVGRLH